jgi:hypothetical protein
VKSVEFFRIKRKVELTAPPDGVFGYIIRNNEFVFWRTSGEFTGIDCQSASVG